MQELIDLVIRYVRTTWQYRWVAAGLAWVVCVAGWVYVIQLPDEYEATARVHVDTQSLLEPLLQGLAIHTDTARRVQLMTRTLLSRPNLEKLARMTDLDIQATTDQEMERLLANLKSGVSLSSGRHSPDLYNVSYNHTQPEVARRVVQSLLTIFVEGSMGGSRADSEVAQKFLDRQIDEYEAGLSQAEVELKEFKRSHMGETSMGQNYFTKLENARVEVEQVRLQLLEIENRRRQLQTQLGQEEGDDLVRRVSSLPVNDSYSVRIAPLHGQLDELLLRFTDKHPDIVEIRRKIELLENQRDAQRALLVGDGRESSAIYQQLKIVLFETEAEIASLRVRLKEYQARAAGLEQTVARLPDVESELGRLQRNYSRQKRQYEEMIERRDLSLMGQKVERSGDSVQFRIVDPPHVPSQPSGPPRLMLMTLVLGLGLGGGVAAAFVVSQIRPTIIDGEMLVQLSGGIPLLGAVSIVSTTGYRRGVILDYVSLGAVVTLLIGCYGGLVGMVIFDVDFQSSLLGLI